jgi:hypothetical protein
MQQHDLQMAALKQTINQQLEQFFVAYHMADYSREY